MTKLLIKRSLNLNGTIEISGSKNAILPIIAATLLCQDEIIIKNVPNLSDVYVMLKLLKELGSNSEFDVENNILIIFKKDNIKSTIDNAKLSEQVRTSSLFLGPLLALNGEAKITKPGGCKIGARLIDMHLHFLKEMGAIITETDEYIHLKTFNKLIGVEARFYKASVGATQHIMIAAILANGQTIIYDGSIEPETVDLGNFLISMGAKIRGLGTTTIIVDGVNRGNLKLKAPYQIIPDRIEAGSFAILALVTRSRICLKNLCIEHIDYVLKILEEVSEKKFVLDDQNNLIIDGRDITKFNSKSIVTAPYPYFPTDLQQIFIVLMCIANGTSIIEEKIFEGRFILIKELIKMGASINQENNNKIIVNGVEKLIGTEISGSDLRGSMALLIAGLIAEGETLLNNIEYLDRGYENLLNKLLNIGAEVCIVPEFYKGTVQIDKQKISI